jgi:hypothetical protein
VKQTPTLLAIAAIVAGALMVLPGNLLASGGMPTGSNQLGAASTSLKTQPPTTQPVEFSENNSPFTLSPTFWGTTVSPRSLLLPGEGTLIKVTRDTTVVWPGGSAGDDYDPLPFDQVNCTESSPLGGCIFTSGGVGTTPVTSEADFVSWCESINCTAIMQVPAEPDNPAFAAMIVNYTENTLHFHPAYWELGNEPELWSNYGRMPWQYCTHRSNPACGDRTVNQSEYAALVVSFVDAIRKVDPHAKIIGLAATGRPNGRGTIGTWIEPIVQEAGWINGSQGIVGIAYHSYPAGGQTPADPPYQLQSFYGAINSTTGILQRVNETRGDVLAGSALAGSTCNRTCAGNISVFITEVGSALSHLNQYHNLSVGFSGALDIAAQMTQAMQKDVINQDLFGAVGNLSNSWFSQQGYVRPMYTLYSQILSHLGNQVYDVTIRTDPAVCPTLACDASNKTLGSDLYGIATTAPSYYDRSDLMVVNLNNSTTVNFVPELPGISTPASAEVWTWSAASAGDPLTAGSSNPIASSFTLGPGNSFTLPPSTVALIEAYPSGGVPVKVQSSGLGVLKGGVLPRWYVEVNGFYWEGNATTTLTMFLPPGLYDVSAPSIPLNDGSALSYFNTERYPKQRLEPAVAPTYEVGYSGSNLTIDWQMQWLTNISANPSSSGYVNPAPSWWDNDTPLVLSERPAFHYAFQYWEGFGPGSVNSTAPTITVDPTDWIAEKAVYAWAYPVTFNETGLPDGAPWSITAYSVLDLRNVIHNVSTIANSTTDVLSLSEPNGTHGFTIGTVPGYRARLVGTHPITNSSFTVNGTGLGIEVMFSPISPPPPRFNVTFQEQGLPVGTPWYLRTLIVNTRGTGANTTVTVEEQNFSSASSDLVIAEVNGTFGYNVSSVPGYLAHNRDDGFVVDGSAISVTIDFYQVTYSVVWEEAGLGPNLTWSVDVSGDPFASAGAWTTARLPNGTYTFSIPQVEDFIPSLRSGGFTVNGQNMTFEFAFPEVNYSVLFALGDAPTGRSIEVRLSNETVTVTTGSNGASAIFSLPNGSYTFDVVPPSGFLASPSHGTVTVDAGAVTINVTLGAAGLPQSPPIWDLALPALIAAVVIAMAGVGTLLLSRRRNRGRPGEEP